MSHSLCAFDIELVCQTYYRRSLIHQEVSHLFLIFNGLRLLNHLTQKVELDTLRQPFVRTIYQCYKIKHIYSLLVLTICQQPTRRLWHEEDVNEGSRGEHLISYLKESCGILRHQKENRPNYCHGHGVRQVDYLRAELLIILAHQFVHVRVAQSDPQM